MAIWAKGIFFQNPYMNPLGHIHASTLKNLPGCLIKYICYSHQVRRLSELPKKKKKKSEKGRKCSAQIQSFFSLKGRCRDDLTTQQVLGDSFSSQISRTEMNGVKRAN